MTIDLAALRTEAAGRRRAAAASSGPAAVGAIPNGQPKREDLRFGSSLRGETVTKDGREFYLVEGTASAFEQAYPMWDFYGPYTEIMSAGSADATLKANPMVVFRFNHGGTAMANTRNGRLELWADDAGLHDRAWLNPARDDVQLLVHAIHDEDVSEQSFMFTITSGQWSPDYDEYRITSFDLDRGDVGPVTYGANPFTSVAARAGDILEAIPELPQLAAREALQLLQARSDIQTALPVPVPVVVQAEPAKPVEPVRVGRSVTLLRTLMAFDDDTDD